MKGVLCVGELEVDCAGVVDIMVFSEAFVVELVEGFIYFIYLLGSGTNGGVCCGACCEAIPVVCEWEGYFLGQFSLKLLEKNGQSVRGFLFWMVIWVNCFVLLERGFFGKKVGVDVLMDVVVEVVVVQIVDVVQAGFFVFLWHDCLGDMVGVRVVIEVVVGAAVLVGAVVLLWWRWPVL